MTLNYSHGLSFTFTRIALAKILAILLILLHVQACTVRSNQQSIQNSSLIGMQEPVAIYHGARDKKRVALTFDACSSSRKNLYDEEIIRILENKNTPATLFLGGKWMTEQANAVRILARNPQFELASHAYLHTHMPRLKPEIMEQELIKSQETLYRLTGKRAILFRAPYADISDELVNIASKQGMKTIQYDLASGDPDKHISASQLRKYVVGHTRPGSIIVMHMNRHGWHTAEVLAEIIDELHSKGYTFVTVSQLIEGDKPVESQVRNDYNKTHAEFPD